MTRAKLIILLRCVTLVAIGGLLWGLGFLSASASLVFVGLFMPPALLSGGFVCTSYCSDSFPGGSLVVAGITDGTCTGCTALNATYGMNVYPGGIFGVNPCEADYYFTSSVSCTPALANNNGFAGIFVFDSGGVRVNGAVGYTNGLSGTLAQKYNAGGSPPVSCVSLAGASLGTFFIGGGAGGQCDTSACTMSISP